MKALGEGWNPELKIAREQNLDRSNQSSFQQSESFYQHLFDSAPDVMMMVDRQGEVQVANSRCRDVLGYSPEDVQGRGVQDLLDEGSRSGIEVMMTGILEGTPMPEAEVDILTGDGKPIPMMLDVRHMEGAGAGHLLVRLRDLREIKTLEQEYRNLFESIGDAVFIGDPESGQVYQANRQACELTGYSLGELIGEDYEQVHSESWEAILKEAEEADGRELSGREIGLRGKGGEEVPVEVHLRIVPRGEDWIYIETAIDISDRKALEARMAELRIEWDSFIRHELRNPLTPIMAFSQILIEDYPEVQRNPKIRQYLDAIWQGGKRLERLLDLTWEVQAYEQGQVPLEYVKADLYQALREAMHDAAMGVDTDAGAVDRLRLIPHEESGDAPELLFPHDPQKFQRVLTNLIKNALEHDPGEVTVRVVDRPEEACVSVHNGGTPIPEDRLKTIFEKFNTTKRDQKGTGLGTTIAKLFVEAHGGHMEVASSEAEGTVFTVSVPKAAPLEAEGQ